MRNASVGKNSPVLVTVISVLEHKRERRDKSEEKRSEEKKREQKSRKEMRRKKKRREEN